MTRITKHRSIWRTAALAPMLAGAMFALPAVALAEGAVAVGTTGNIANDGFAYGRNTGAGNAAIARESALRYCRTFQGATPAARSACVIVSEFHDQCQSIAMDPKAGTPGVGWAVAPNKKQAVEQAMANCMATAGEDRRQFCVESDTSCDGDAR